MNRKLNLLLTLAFFVNNLLSGCNLSEDASKSQPSQSSTEPEVCQKLSWNKVKSGLKGKPDLFDELETIYFYISSCQIKPRQAKTLIDIYNSTNNREQRIKLLRAINNNYTLIENNKKILKLYKTVSKTEDIFLAKLAVQGLGYANQVDELLNLYKFQNDDKIRVEILSSLSKFMENENDPENKDDPRVLQLYYDVAASDDRTLAPVALIEMLYLSDSENWTTWLWEPQILQILENTVEKDFYKLSNFGVLELLALVKQYPNSQYTKACIEYRNLTSGTYFGSNVRQQIYPNRELGFWPEFLKKYPGHSGSDDAMYRMARSYEMLGDYETALLWHYKASQTPDGSITASARDRILFIIDLLMSSDSLSKFIKNHQNHPLVPHIEYSKAIHLIREEKFELAKVELEKFINNYKDSKSDIFFNDFEHYHHYYSLNHYHSYFEDNPSFWKSITTQKNNIIKIIEMQQKTQSDKHLYEQAAFWFYNDFLAYNHFWNGGLWGEVQGAFPAEWEGIDTSINKNTTYELAHKVNQKYKSQIRYLKSIYLFEKLLKDHPDSELAERAKYSIGLNYYYLGFEDYPELLEQEFSWNEMAIKSYKDFVEKFPNSSMADDALIVVASLESKEVAKQVLEKVVKDYPDGDRYEQAEAMLNKLKSESQTKAPPPQQASSPVAGVGIRMQNIETGNGVLIQEPIPGLPASQAGLQSGDIILSVDNQSVTNTVDVARIVRQHQIGETVRFEIERQGQKFVVDVVTTSISF